MSNSTAVEMYVKQLWDITKSMQLLGWMLPGEAKCNSQVKLKIIEVGSTGIHLGWKDEEGDFYVSDETDVCHSYPAFVKELD